MSIDAIKSELHRSPFRPFKLTLADGREVRVPHHEYVMFSPGGGTLWVFSSPEAYTTVETALITQIIPEMPAGGNGEG